MIELKGAKTEGLARQMDDKCIFNNALYCKHFNNIGNTEYRCLSFRQKCDNLRRKIEFEVDELGLVKLIFKKEEETKEEETKEEETKEEETTND